MASFDILYYTKTSESKDQMPLSPDRKYIQCSQEMVEEFFLFESLFHKIRINFSKLLSSEHHVLAPIVLVEFENTPCITTKHLYLLHLQLPFN